MKKILLLFGLLPALFFIIPANAQPSDSIQIVRENSNPNLKALMETERSFARLASDSSIHVAFLTYLDDSAVIFRNGEIKNGKKQYGNAKDDKGLLTWGPDFADVAASGDFGYDTGPSEFWNARSDEKPVYYGNFVSVWTKQPDGKWKVMLDLGVGHPEPKNENQKIARTSGITSTNNQDKTGFQTEMFTTEEKFMASFDQSGTSAYATVNSTEARFYRVGLMPLVKPASIQEMLNQQAKNKKVSYKIVGGMIASSGDIGCIYGTAKVEFLKDNKKQEQTNYVRIWKKENGKNWKLVVDVLLSK